MGRGPGNGEYKVRKAVTVPISLAEWADVKGFDYSEVLTARLRQLKEAADDRQGAEDALKFHKNDMGPHSENETRDYFKFVSAMTDDERRTLPLDDKFRMWREARGDLKVAANEPPAPPA